MSSKPLYAVIAAIALTLAACGKKEEPPKAQPAPPPPVAAPAPPPAAPAGVAVSSVTIGKAIGADKKVTAATDTFAKGDTLYASIDTTGMGGARLDAKWTFRKGGKVAVVKEDSMTIDAEGPATHEFNVSKPDGWPAGDYEVEIMLDGKPAGGKKFVVK